MAVTFVAASTIGTVAANPPTFNLTLPALLADDIIVIAVMSKNIVEASNEIATPTTASGTFTEKGAKTEVDSATAADDMRTALYYKRAVSANSGASVTVSRAGTDTLGLYAVASVWRGAIASGDPFDTVGIVIGGSATAGDVIVFPAIDPVATDVHVIYDGWKADDVTTALANFSNDSTTFVIRDDQETTTGSDATHGIWSADRNGNPLSAVSASVVGTDGSYIGYSFALLPAPPVATGTLEATDPVDVAALAGDVLVEGDLAATEGLDTAALAGDVLVEGDLAATDSLDVAAFEGTVADAVITGTLAATDLIDVAAFAGDVLVEGDLAATDPADIAAIDGTVSGGDITGTLDATEALDTIEFSGTAVGASSETPTGGIARRRIDKRIDARELDYLDPQRHQEKIAALEPKSVPVRIKAKAKSEEIATGLVSQPPLPPVRAQPQIYRGTPRAERRKILQALYRQKIAGIIAADDEWFMMN